MNPVLTPRVGELTKLSWERIVSGDAQGFKKIQENDPTVTSLVYFYDRFYTQLFFLYPEVKRFFQASISSQGRRLVKSLMGLATITLFDTSRVHSRLVELTNTHNTIGIHPMYYGGFVWNMIITLRHCLGEDWTNDIQEAWTIAGSYMLRTMVPVAVRGTRNFASPYAFPRMDNNQEPESEVTISQSSTKCSDPLSQSSTKCSDPLSKFILPVQSTASNPPPTHYAEDNDDVSLIETQVGNVVILSK